MNAETIQKNWNESIWIKDDTSGASLLEREREIFLPNDVLEKVAEKILTKKIKTKICKLEKQVEDLKYDSYKVNVSKSAATELLRDTIIQFKGNGIKEIDIIDLHTKTKLPIQQIGEIMDELEQEGVVSDYGEN